MSKTTYLRIAFFLLGLVLIVGCEKKKPVADLTGTVTYNGAPVTGGDMVFHTSEGVYSTSIGSDGHYSLSQVPPGEATVTINTESLNPNHKTPTYDPKTSAGSGAAGKYGKGSPPPSASKGAGKMKVETSPPPEGTPKNNPGVYVKIPKIYSEPTKSPLKVTVQTGKQELNLELKD